MNSVVLDFIILHLETIYIVSILAYCIWDFQGEYIVDLALNTYPKSYLFCSKNKNDIIVSISIAIYAISCIVQLYVLTQMHQMLCEPKPRQEQADNQTQEEQLSIQETM